MRWLLEKFSNDKLIIIDNDDEDEALAGFISFHLTNEIDSFRESLASFT